jgi:hypothetical protein
VLEAVFILLEFPFSFEKDFYRLPFTTPLWFAISVLQTVYFMDYDGAKRGPGERS